MNNEAIQRIREPAAWALLGAVIAQMLAAMVGWFSDGNFALSLAGSSGTFFGPVTVATVAFAVYLGVGGPRAAQRAFPLALTGLILLGVGALVGVINLIATWFAFTTLASSFSHFLSTGGQLAILAAAGYWLFLAINDPRLVPRPQGATAGGGAAYAPGHGADLLSGAPSPTPDPAQTGQGYQAGGQAAYGQAAVQGYQTGAQAGYAQADPSQTGQGYQAGGQAAYGQAAVQGYQTGAQAGYAQADPSQTGQGYQAGYGQGAAPGYQTGGQAAYGQAGQGYQTGGQTAYGAADPGQTVQGYQTGAQAGYGQGAAPGYQTGGQAAYGQADPSQTGQGYQAGAQPGYGQQGGYGQYQQPGGYPQQDQQQYGTQQGYGWYGQQAGAAGTGGQPSYRSVADDEATVVQTPNPLGAEEPTLVQGENPLSDDEPTLTQGGGANPAEGAGGGYPRRDDRMELPQGWYRDDDR